MMGEMKIGGYTIEELKKVQAEVRKDASKIIAENISAGEDAVKEIISLTSDDRDEQEIDDELKAQVTALAVVAEEKLALAKLVSDISGVAYYLPFREYGHGDSYHNDLENNYGNLPDNPEFGALFSVLEDMESDSRDWHSSRC